MPQTNERPLYASALQTTMLMPLFRGEKPQPYVQQFRWIIKDPVDFATWKRLWQYVLRRHDCFYYRFSLNKRGKVEIQRANRLQVQFHHEDWSRNTAEARRKELRKFLQDDQDKGFSSKGPLCRMQCIRFNAEHTEWIITSHHVLFDGRARRILLKEFLTALQAEKEGRKPQPPPPPRFSDHLRWLNQQNWNQAGKFWSEQLKSLEQPTPLEISHGEILRHKGFGQVGTTLFNAKKTTRIHAWSKRTGYSINTLVQAAWGIFLSRSSGATTVAFAAPRACRKTHTPGAENMVGLLMNTVPVVVDGMFRGTAEEYLEIVHYYWKNLRDYEHTPYQIIQKAANVSPHNPLYSSYVGFENTGLRDWSRQEDLPEIEAELRGFTEIPLSLHVTGGRTLKLEVTYDKSRFSPAVIKRATHGFRVIIEALAGNPEARVRDIEMLDPDQQKQIVKIGAGPRPSMPDKRIHKVFEAIAEKNAHRPALRFLDKTITYRELDERANQLGRLLLRDGLKSGDAVGLFFNRNPEALVSQLAVLKAGGVYVPLNPNQPRERLDWMLKNSQLKTVLTHSSLERRIRRNNLKVLSIDTGKLRIRRFSTTAPKTRLPENPDAYIMYTSGSTGRPKGVVVPQAGVVRLVHRAGYVKLGPKTRMLQLTALTFDLSVFEIWGALLNGGTCVLYPGAEANFDRLHNLIRMEKVNTMLLSASVFNAIMDTSPDILDGVEQLVIGAEALSPRHVHKALKVLPKLRFINGYGPTEATALTNCHVIDKKQRADRSVPIGLPINHSTAYVLDPCLRLLPPGIPGELFVGGIGLATGYKGDAAKTAEKFIPNPLKTKGDPMLYRTGDRAFLNPSGNFEYLERFDDQVKIRGHRIEPGEIRAALVSLPVCKDAFVLPVRDPRGETELAAFIIPAAGKMTEKDEVLEGIGRKLPAYMIPTRVLFTDSFPLTSSGKVDRKALLERVNHSPPHPEEGPPATRPVERQVSRIWKEVLKQTPSNPEADFFESGGNSLLATSFVFRIQQELKVNLSFREFEANPGIRSLARWIDREKKKTKTTTGHRPLVLRKLKPRRTYPLGLKWRTFCIPDILEPDAVKSLLITRAVILEGDLQPDLLKQAMEEVIQHNERLRTSATIINGELLEKVEDQVVLDFPVKDLSHEKEEKALKIAMAIFRKESLANMNMRYAPQLRVQLLKLSRQRYFLSFVIQHAVADGYAVEMFYKQTSKAYNALRSGKASPLKPPPYTYREFETHLEKWLKQGNQRRIKRFWRKELKGLKPIAYPFLVAKVPDDIGWNKMDHYHFLPEWRERILSFAKHHGISTFVFFMTVVKLLISRYTGSRESYITSAVNGRTGSRQKDIFGDFSSTILVRTRLKEQGSFLEHARAEAGKLFVCMDHKYINANGIEAPHKKQVAHPHSVFGQLQVIEGVDTGDSLQLDAVRSTFLNRKKTGALTRLGFITRDSQAALQITFAYAPMIFVPNSIERLKHHFQEFVRIVLDNPHISLNDLPDLSRPDACKRPLSNQEKANHILRPLQA